MANASASPHGDTDPAAPTAAGADAALPPDDGRAAEAPTKPVQRVLSEDGHPVIPVRLFGSRDFFRLWQAQVVSALGDWIGFFAIVIIAGRIGGSSAGVAVGVVMIARIAPGFFLAPVAGVLLDRWDRKRVMVVCDIGRGLVMATLPFIDTLPQLVLASFLLEVLTLMWSPAKDAMVPNLVPAGQLATINSLSLVAAYGTFPIASLIFAGLAKVADVLSRNETFDFLDLNQESVAVYFDVATFFLSALLISTIAYRRPTRERTSERRIDFAETFHELKEGWRFIFVNPTVRAVMVAVGTGLVGGGMLVPLGEIFTSQVLGGGAAGFGLVLTALGCGVGVGVLVVSLSQSRLPKLEAFTVAVLAAGVSLLVGASVGSLTPALVCVAIMGVSAGFVYVLGFTILQESVDDELRGRTFTALYTIVRLCLLISFGVGPFLSGALDTVAERLVGGEIEVGGFRIDLYGVRLTLWLAGFIIVVAGVLSWVALRHARGRAQTVAASP